MKNAFFQQNINFEIKLNLELDMAWICKQTNMKQLELAKNEEDYLEMYRRFLVHSRVNLRL